MTSFLSWLFDDPTTLVWAAIAALVLGYLYIWDKQKKSHRRRQRLSLQTLRKLRQMQPEKHGREMFGYLRSLDPFVFEELILDALKDRNLKIKRNKKYTGDGGVDGQCYFQGKKVLIQAKRYRNHIDPMHISELAEICRRNNCRGLFVHTGKTGQESWNLSQLHTHITIISGKTLLRLFAGDKITVFGERI